MARFTGPEIKGEPYALLWIDLETTGFEPLHPEGHILEAAWIETDFRYPYRPRGEMKHVVFEAPEHWNPFALDEKVFDMHSRSGLLSDVKKSTISRENFLSTLQSTTVNRWPALSRDDSNLVMLAGATVAFDHRWLKAKLSDGVFWRFLSHQLFDASGAMNYARSLGMPKPEREDAPHRAKEDVLRAIDLARACADWQLRQGMRPPNWVVPEGCGVTGPSGPAW